MYLTPMDPAAPIMCGRAGCGRRAVAVLEVRNARRGKGDLVRPPTPMCAVHMGQWSEDLPFGLHARFVPVKRGSG